MDSVPKGGPGLDTVPKGGPCMELGLKVDLCGPPLSESGIQEVDLGYVSCRPSTGLPVIALRIPITP